MLLFLTTNGLFVMRRLRARTVEDVGPYNQKRWYPHNAAIILSQNYVELYQIISIIKRT